MTGVVKKTFNKHFKYNKFTRKVDQSPDKKFNEYFFCDIY